MADPTIKGKVVVITGGGRGLGRAMALGLVEAGAHVTITAAREGAELEKTAAEAREIGGPDFSACLKITRNRAMAEDAVQEALLSAWAKRSQFHHDSRLDTWIHRIAVNAALQLIIK